MLVLVLIFNSLHAVPNILIEKELKFEKKLLVEIIPAVGYAAVATACVYSGYGLWSLVYGRVFSALITIPIVWKMSPFRPTFGFDLAIAKKLFSYGKFVALGAIASFIAANIDDVIVGKALDFTFLGFYSMAFTVSNLVVVNVAQIINRVSFPTYARVSGNAENLKKMLLLTIRYISIIAAPFSMILITLGHELTRVLLGEKWLPMVPVLQIICLSSFLRALFSNTGPLFNGVGKPQYVFFINIVQAILLLIFLVPMTIFFNISGTALGALFVAIIIGFILLGMLKKIIDLRFMEIIRNVGPSVGSACIVGSLNFLWLKFLAPAAGFHVFSLFIIFFTLSCSLLFFTILLYLINKKVLTDMISFIRGERIF
jgi:O-antigen/teichoic acid export membrane protein